VMLLGPLLIMY